MDRFVILVAEPAPLLSLYAAAAKAAAAVGHRQAVTKRRHDSRLEPWLIMKAIQDLQHLKIVVDSMSEFCRHHYSICISSSSSGISGPDSLSLPQNLSNAIAAVSVAGQQQPHCNILKRDDDGGGKPSTTRRVLLSAVFPCPTADNQTGDLSFHSLFGTGDDAGQGDCEGSSGSPSGRNMEKTQTLLPLASTFADVLNSCGTWLHPEDFERRVLGPTRTLLEMQLEHLSSTTLLGRKNGDEGNSICSTSDVGPDNCRASIGNTAEHQISGAPTRLSSGTNAAAAQAAEAEVALEQEEAESEAFVQEAADEIALLVEDALLVNSEPANASPGGDEIVINVTKNLPPRPENGTDGSSPIEEKSRATGRHVLLDVLWAASSIPSGGSDLTDRTRLESSDDRQFGRSGRSRPPMQLTLSVPVVDRRAAPLKETLRSACSAFSESLVTIWPAAAAVASATVAVDKDSDGGCNTVSGDACEAVNLFGQGEPEKSAAIEATETLLCEEWTAWSRFLGATVFVAPRRINQDTHTLHGMNIDNPVLPGLLWRGSIVPAPTTILHPRQEFSHASSSSTTAVTAPSPAHHSDTQLQDRDNSNVMPKLSGFAIRAVADSCDYFSRLGKENYDGEVSKGHSRGRVLMANDSEFAKVARRANTATTADAFAWASELRLARVVSPTALARVCHLLTDGALASPLELFVYDPYRFPGSSSFLEDLGKDGRGMLLVAPESPAPGALSDMAEARNGKGLAMVCFPCPGRRNSGVDVAVAVGDDTAACETRSAAVWTVTLFRRSSEFSEEAVKALVGDNLSRFEKTVQAEQGAVVGVEDTDKQNKGSKRSFADILTSVPKYRGNALQREAAALVRQADGRDTIPIPPPVRRSSRRVAAKTIQQATPGTPSVLESAEGDTELAAQIDDEMSMVVANLNAVMDARAAQLRNISRLHNAPAANKIGGDPARFATVTAIGSGRGDRGETVAASALYGTFGTWDGDDRVFWAEECLLPFSGSTSVAVGPTAGTTGVRQERSGADATKNGMGGTSSGGEGKGGTQDGGKTASTSELRFASTEAEGRALSTAEEALEKAGRQQRERMKQRKIVAREQRARMDCPRPRPRSSSGSGSGGGVGCTADVDGVVRRPAGSSSGSSGKGRFLRREGSTSSLTTGPPPPHGAARSVAASRLSRGSRLLGKSVGVGAAVATPDTAVSLVNSSSSGGGREAVEAIGGNRRRKAATEQDKVHRSVVRRKAVVTGTAGSGVFRYGDSEFVRFSRRFFFLFADEGSWRK